MATETPFRILLPFADTCPSVTHDDDDDHGHADDDDVDTDDDQDDDDDDDDDDSHAFFSARQCRGSYTARRTQHPLHTGIGGRPEHQLLYTSTPLRLIRNVPHAGRVYSAQYVSQRPQIGQSTIPIFPM